MPEETGLTGSERCCAKRGAHPSGVVEAKFEVYVKERTIYHNQSGGNTVEAHGYIGGSPTGPRHVSEELIESVYRNKNFQNAMQLATAMFGTGRVNPSDIAVIKC